MEDSVAVDQLVNGRYYSACTGGSGYTWRDIPSSFHFVVDRKKALCDSPGSSGFSIWGRYDSSAGSYWEIEEHSCESYEKCDEDHDNLYTTSETYDIVSNNNPCRIEEGTGEDNQCSDSDDCYDDATCGGAQTLERWKCVTDGNVYAELEQLSWLDTCGGDGDQLGDWGTIYSPFDCTSDSELEGGSGYVCDSDHDLDPEIFATPTNLNSPCRKNIGESCSMTTDCWNDDGGNWCNSLSECSDGANGRDCGSGSDCNSGFCCSGTCSGTTCEVEEVEYCDGTLNIVGSDEDLNIFIDSAYKSTTDVSNFYSQSYSGVVCGTSYDVIVKCSDNSTICHSATTYINTDGETATVVDSDCVLTCSDDNNLWLTNKDVDINGNNINLTIHSAAISGGVSIRLEKINRETGLIDEDDGVKTISTSIGAKSTKTEFTTWDLSEASGLNIYIEGADDDKSDNFVYRVISEDAPKAYLSINTSYPQIDSLIKTYLKQYVVYETDVNDAELIISVGRFTDEFEEANEETLEPDGAFWWKKQGWGYVDEAQQVVGGGRYITAYGKGSTSTYSGIVGRVGYNNKPLVLVYGVGVDGDIAATKKLISSRNFFFNRLYNVNFDLPPIILDKYDKLALGVNNILPKNTKVNSSGYLKSANDIFFDNIYDVAIRTVKTLPDTTYEQSTILRLKNVNSDYSPDFKDAISNNERPVVFSGGIFNDLEYWEEPDYDFLGIEHLGLAREMANEGRDTWEIEMNSGPTTDECDDCPNYNYSDMVQYFWPVLIAGVQNYSGKPELDYVGYSQGCRVGLDSLETFENGQDNVGYYFNFQNGQYEFVNLGSDPINTFVGLGCSGTFKGYSFFKDYFGKYGDDILESSGSLDHISNRWLGEKLLENCQLNGEDFPSCHLASISLKKGEEKYISKNSAIYYLNEIEDSSSDQPGTGVNLESVLIIHGHIDTGIFTDLIIPNYKEEQDGLASANDSIEIFNGILGNGKIVEYNLLHTEFADDFRVKKEIEEFLR